MRFVPPKIGNRAVPAPALFVLGGTSMYIGAALAVGLFDQLSPSVVAMLRLSGAAVVLLGWRRPGRATWGSGSRMRRAVAFGFATGLMNLAFYEAVARLPLGTAVAVEFCGPVVVAAVAARRARDGAAVGLAAVGVLLIADVRWSGSSSGMLWALAAAAMWAAYVVLGKRVAGAGSGLNEMAVGFTVAAVALSPLLLLGGLGLSALADPRVLALAVGVGLLSSVLPYVLDQMVLRRVGQARFAILLALLPATATVLGLIVLGQVPGVLEGVGIVLVIAAVALRSGDGDVPAVPLGDRHPGRSSRTGALHSHGRVLWGRSGVAERPVRRGPRQGRGQSTGGPGGWPS
ncbi:MAG: EamA family transporter [Pseudonocardia sp.]